MSSETITSAGSALAAEVDRMRAASWRKYREILASPEGLSDAKGITALRNAAGALGKSPGDVEADGRVLGRARRLQERLAAAKSMEELKVAHDAVTAHDAETARIMSQRCEEYRQVYAAYRAIDTGRVAAQMARKELDKLVATHGELLTDE